MRVQKILTIGVMAASMVWTMPAMAQTYETQDISATLQANLEASAPTIVYFGFDKDELTSDARSILDLQASWLLANPEAKVNLAGHTDAVGSNAYNDDLAMRRAKSVENYLLSKGVNAAQMQSVISRGETDLVVQTQGREQLNRRVTTGVTGLVEIYIEPQVVEYVPPSVTTRTYSESPGLLCAAGAGEPLTQMTDMEALRGELQTRLDAAASIYESDKARQSDSSLFDLAAFTKAECGIAIGFTKSDRMDERSVTNCACYSTALSNL